MEKNAHYFVVGVFVTGALLGAFMFLIWLASPHDERTYDYYTVEFKASISGLEEGSSVEYKGVKVGKVMKMRLAPANSEIVYVDIGVDKTTPVHTHTKAMLETQGITGLVRIELATKQDDAGPPERREGQKYPVLEGEGSKLYQALEDLPDITNKILDISKKFDQFLDDQTVAALKQTVQNAQNMSKDLNGLLSPSNVTHMSTMVDNLTASSAQVPDMIDHLKKTADQMDAASASLNGILTRNKGHIDQFASEGLSQITAVSREAKGTANSLRGLADKLKSDPSQILYQPSSRGVEIPK
jgi:phospholipid/cholesterol/gamma-HCH transport system substrate-binding protein